LDQQLAQNLTDLEQAEKDLRFYSALIGRRPTMDATVPIVEEYEVVIPEPIKLYPELVPDPMPPKPQKPHALRLWMRDLSNRAKRRLDEAYHRLAS
jgi:hypothetical protein